MSTATTTGRPAAPGLEHKASSTSPDVGLLGADDATGVVEAIVSVTGVCDHDNDIIEPGSYAKTLANRRPKGIFVHDWAKWVARTEHIEELLPGDPRLPPTTKGGKAWPREAGGLYVKARFNLNTDEGRNAYHNVKFFSETGECEWSVGYRVPPGKATKDKQGRRRIKEMDLFEYSPVLFGANSMSGTMSVKSAITAEPLPDVDDDLLDAPEDEFVDAAETDDDGDGVEGDEDATDGWHTLSLLAEDVNDDDLPETTKVTPPLDDADTEEDQPGGPPPLDPAAEGEDGEGKSLFEIKPPPLHDPYQAVFREFRDLNVPEILDSTMQERVKRALFNLREANGNHSFPEAHAALTVLLNELRTSKNPEIRSFTDGAAALLRRAGEATTVKFVTKTTQGADEEKMAHESLDRSPRSNWVEKAGELPAYIQHIAKDIHEKRGMPLAQAIPIAIAAVKKWAAGGDDVSAQTRAKAAKAVAEWEKLKAASHAKKDDDEVIESGRYPYLPGTFEELRDQLREEAAKAFNTYSLGQTTHVEVIGTWPSHAIVTAYTVDGKAQTFELPYTLTADGESGPATLVLERPEPVMLTVSVDEDEEEEAGEKMLPFPSMIDEATVGLKTWLLHAETKAGRVLSGVNERRLLGAVESLVAVLKAAGLEINTKPKIGDKDEKEAAAAADPLVMSDSTAPSARAETLPAKVFPDPEMTARAYRILAEAAARRLEQ